ncbi:hypothetical protein JKF63_03958 [Porcisia hertigi]|uniref:Uncharacterized protein n=1 Tax=Porcisia hertigi TaxID=2761500 RepID=A0A836L5B1_9TRYP|nr:hypothetical protein JKF63_03958 [Porcisia hertigi]
MTTEPPGRSAFKPVQIVVRKQGRYERGLWTTRILTVDVDAGTVAISRKHKPDDVFHRTLNVQDVQMWPHYDRDAIEGRYDSLKAKMVLCITGTEVALANHTKASHSRSFMSRMGSFLSPPRSSTEGSLLGGNSRASVTEAQGMPKKNRISFPAHSRVWHTLNSNTISWFIHFTSIDSYELALMLFLRFKDAEGLRRTIFFNHMAMDLAVVKAAWAKHSSDRKQTASLPSPEEAA